MARNWQKPRAVTVGRKNVKAARRAEAVPMDGILLLALLAFVLALMNKPRLRVNLTTNWQRYRKNRRYAATDIQWRKDHELDMGDTPPMKFCKRTTRNSRRAFPDRKMDRG